MVDRTGHTRYRKRGLEPAAEKEPSPEVKRAPATGIGEGEGEFVAGTLQNWLWDCRHSNQSKL